MSYDEKRELVNKALRYIGDVYRLIQMVEDIIRLLNALEDNIVIYKTHNIGYTGGDNVGILGKSRAPRPRTPFGRFFARPAVRRIAVRLRYAMTGKTYTVRHRGSTRPRRRR